MVNVLGPDIHVKDTGKLHFVQFGPDGVFGWIFTDSDLTDSLLRELFEPSPRKRRASDDPTEARKPDLLPRIPNPLACISTNDMLIFQFSINFTDRLSSHFPVYQKEHLFNSNPNWDFGALRKLQYLIQQTKFNSSRFAHVFSEAGTYVFVDNVVPEWNLIVVVHESGTGCDPELSAFHPASPAMVVRHRVIRQRHLNLLPDWGIITGILALALVLVVVLTVVALLLKPHRAHFITQGKPKPKWRSLGEPLAPLEYVYNRESPCRPEHLSLRGVGEGAEAEEPSIYRGGSKAMYMELEEFNVKTLYDKLEDQNLHLASQLAKHRKDTQEFYRNICHRANTLQEVLQNMEPTKLKQLKESNDLRNRHIGLLQGAVGEEKVLPLGLMKAQLQALEDLLARLSQESPGDSRDCELHMVCTQVSSADMVELPLGREVEPDLSNTVQAQSGALYLAEQDLSKLVDLTPLSRTLLEIQQSLQRLPRVADRKEEEEVIAVRTSELTDAQLSPVSLDILSPQHTAIFLFGCHVVRLLRDDHGFPPIMLLLARTVPVSHCNGIVAYCNKDFYYDTQNQILYLLEAKLQNAGHFIATLVHSMAYIIADSGKEGFIAAFHKAIAALSLQLFTHSFSPEVGQDGNAGALSSVVEDFFSVRVMPEAQFSPQRLANRLQTYKHFQLEKIIHDLRTTKHFDGPKSCLNNSSQVLCVDKEVKQLNDLYLDLQPQSHRPLMESLLLESSEKTSAKTVLSQDEVQNQQTKTLVLSQQNVVQRLAEIRERLLSSKISAQPEPTSSVLITDKSLQDKQRAGITVLPRDEKELKCPITESDTSNSSV
ncbi:uncharacterized protein LOC114784814 [Denticeps clupeoides]|uniref:uncharacterized protein LOC114784814 n=1 Tax=Denticeps clupeoides TaxID=299321 RepID=UPI0010A4C85E|nr:uncharacterized protein LOC114784814 [Denticeps clupeoides]